MKIYNSGVSTGLQTRMPVHADSSSEASVSCLLLECSSFLCSLLATRSLKINPPSSGIATTNLSVPRKNSISDWMLVEDVIQVCIHPQEYACTYTHTFAPWPRESNV